MAWQETIHSIETEIAKGQTEAAINKLLQATKNVHPKVYHFSLQLKSRWERLQKQQMLGVYAPEDVSKRQNRINLTLLKILEALKQEEKLPTAGQKALFWFGRRAIPLAFVIWGLLLIGFLLLSQMKAGRVPAQIEVVASRIEFTSKEAGDFFDGQPFQLVQLQEYQSVSIPSDTADLDTDLDGAWDERRLPTGPLVLEPDFEGSVLLENVRLGNLSFSKNSRLSLETDEPGNYNIGLARAAGIQANFYLPDTFFFETRDNLIPGWDYFDPIRVRIVYGATPPNLNVQSHRRLQLALRMEEPMAISEDFLAITDSIHFEKIDRSTQERKVESTIQRGEVRWQGLNRPVALDKGAFLSIDSYDNLQIQELSLSEDGLRLTLQGDLRDLRSGFEYSALHAVMPTRWEKLWATNIYLILIALFLALLTTIVLLYLNRQNARQNETSFDFE